MRRAGPTLVLWIAWLAFGVGCGEQKPPPAASAAPAETRATPAAAPAPATDQRRARPLPAFDGQDLGGTPWRTAELLGKRTVVFGFDPGAPAAKIVARALAGVAGERGAHNFEIVGVATGAGVDAARSLLAEQRLEIRTFADAGGELGRRIGVRQPVWLVITDVDGNLLYGEEYFPAEGPDPSGAVEQTLRAQLRLPGRQNVALGAHPLAPAFSAERLEGGPRFELASLRGKPAILIFFLHTCPHCHEALGFLKKTLAELPESTRPALVGVSIANGAWSVQAALKEQGLDFFPVLLDLDASIRTAYSALQGVPVTFLLDADGRIVSRTDGWSGERDPALVRMRLSKIAGQPVPMLLHKTGYSGNEVCSVCHESEAATWELTNHASAFDTLVRHGADGRGECVTCHVVGYGKTGGYQVSRPDPGLENVGCESCHGRGGPHLSPDFVKDHAYEEACQSCHNPEHSLGFEYASFLPRVSHAANRTHLALPPEEREKLLAARKVPRKDLLPTAATYVGSEACQSCHRDEHATWLTQPHAKALDTLAAKGKAGDADCLRCHTTGFGKPGGFQAGAGAQPALAGVGCESCHGPGGDHVGADARKQGTILKLSDKCGSCAILQVCGTCHDDANDPGFEFEVIDKVLRQRHGKEELDIDGGRKALPPSAALGLLERAFARGTGVSRNVATHDGASGVHTITIDREDKRNALDRATLAELEAAFAHAAERETVRVIVLRGAGDRAFCAGADLAEVLGHTSLDESRRHFDGVARVMRAMERAPQPVIARVPGFALAGGCGLAVAADFTLAAESAVFGLPEIGIGLLPLMVSVPILRAVGSRKVLIDLVLTGRRVAAPEAHALGLATRVVPDAELDRAVAELAEQLAGHSPLALRLGKEALYTMAEMEASAALTYLRDAIVLLSRSEDAREGITAFFEKRRPTWTGR